MILELIAVLVAIFILCMQYRMHQQSDQTYNTDDENVVENPSIPRPIIIVEKPVVTASIITDTKATIDVTPAWFEPVKPVPESKIRFPTNYNRNSPVTVRTYNCLANYRSMMNKTDEIDFVAEPFVSSVESSETLVVVLNELVQQLGARLTFTNADFNYNDSDYRTACGVGNLGSIHSFLASEGKFETAKFNLHLKLDYNEITATVASLNQFVLTLINDIVAIIQCRKDFIRVFSVTQVSSIAVQLGITTPDLQETVKLAEALKLRLNQVSSVQRQNILKFLFPEHYDYKMEAALAFLQLQESDFDPRFNRDYPDADEEIRGGYPYYFPEGWYRHALKVIGKYAGDEIWLGMNNSPGEWAVAYHGTKSHAVRGITDGGLLHKFVTADFCKEDAMAQNPNIPDVAGLYVATHANGGADCYTDPFEVMDSNGTSKNYEVVFQCRVQPNKFTEHSGPVTVGLAWRVFDEKAIRPYGLLLRCPDSESDGCHLDEEILIG